MAEPEAILLITIAIVLVAILMRYLNRDYNILALCRRFKTSDGRALEDIVAIHQGNTVFGNSFDVMFMDLEQLFNYNHKCAQQFRRTYIQHVALCPIYNVIDAENAEIIFNDNRLNAKADLYTFLYTFLKTGLLTSSGKKWHHRRRLLTPAFHFNILFQFEPIFKRESLKLVNILHEKLKQLNAATSADCTISLSDLIPRLTLNTICETALGVQLDQCYNGDEYRKNIEKVEKSLMLRIQNPFYMFETIYNLFGNGREDRRFIGKLHEFSSNIIQKRRVEFEQACKQNEESGTSQENAIANNENDSIYKKQRYAMLDTLLMAEKNGLIDHAGICEEVDTFMFEGFDTTSMALIFALMNLSLYQEMQQKCYEEINEFIEDDLSKFNLAQLANLRYLDCFIKESLRLYPSVPIILRENLTDVTLSNQIVLPKGTQICVHIFEVHRNPKYYDEPEQFRPERFLPENSAQRHPFAFIPFSAGQRNCIGQKFALLEIKTVLVYILKHFKLEAVMNPKQFRFLAGILLRSQSDIQVKIVKR